MRDFVGPLFIGLLLATASARAQQPVAMTVPAPELKGVTDWINTKPFKLADRKGEVIVLHFWTFG